MQLWTKEFVERVLSGREETDWMATVVTPQLCIWLISTDFYHFCIGLIVTQRCIRLLITQEAELLQR